MDQLDKIIDRSHQSAAKHEEMEQRFGRSDLIPLWVADMDFEVPIAIKDALMARSNQPVYGYTTRPDSYFDSVVDWYERRHGVFLAPSTLIHSPGVVTSLNVAVTSFTKPGDEIIIQPPVYYPFYDAIRGNGRRVVENPLVVRNNQYEMDFEGLEELVQTAKMLILCNPHNPVGRVWTEGELDRLCDICDRHDVKIISDEIHADLVFRPNRYTSILKASKTYPSTVVALLSPTKTFNLAGLQASFIAVSNKRDYAIFQKFFNQFDLVRNSCFNLVAVETAYRKGEPWLETMLDYVRDNMHYVDQFCKAHIPECVCNHPEGTYLQWLDCRQLELDDEALSRFFVHEAGIAAGMGAGYGINGSGYVRLNLACSKLKVEEAMTNLKAAVERKYNRNTYKEA